MKYTTWLKTASIFQFITAAAHSLSFFVKPQPKNETEKQLLDLMASYSMDLGGGFHRSMDDIVMALSACFPLLYILGGLINLYLLSQKPGGRILKGVISINLCIFTIAFALFVIYTFLPPIILSGLVFLFLVIAYFTSPKNSAV